MNITCLPCDASDADFVFKYNKALIDEYEMLESINYDKVLDWVQKKVIKNIDKYNKVYLNGEPAGYYYFHPEDGKMEIDDLYIFPPFRNAGIGTEIIQKCISDTPLPVFLYVFSRNEKAVSLYQRLGFKITEQIQGSRYVMQFDKW